MKKLKQLILAIVLSSGSYLVSAQWLENGSNIYTEYSGNVGIGTWSPQAKLHVTGGEARIEGVGLNVLGGYGIKMEGGGNVNCASGDSRFFWGSWGSVFRTGFFTTAWSSPKGDNSLAGGTNTIASGENSFAYGYMSAATGNSSAAFGQAKAEGQYSFATGGSTAIGSYTFSTASAIAAADYSAAFNKGTSGGNYSAAFNQSTARGLNSVAMNESGSGGESSTAIGSSLSDGAYSLAAGRSYTLGKYSAAFGYSQALTDYTFSAGYLSVASGVRSVAMGSFVSAQGRNSIILGRGLSNTHQFINKIDDSFMVGFNSEKLPSIFVGPADPKKEQVFGFVGIGTTTPKYELSVNGTIVAKTGVVVENLAGEWPDYVFGAGYSLMPLRDVEKFITANHHLPGVPSEQQIKNEGLNVGNMEMIMMQKIEELTLHMIRLEKENAVLRTTVETIQNKK